MLIKSLTEKDDPYYKYCTLFDGDEVTLSGARSESNGEALIRNAYHISHVYYPYFCVEPSFLEFEADAVWMPQSLDVWAMHFDSIIEVKYESSAGADSRFLVIGDYIYPLVQNTDYAPYSEIFTVTAFDGKNSVQRQVEVRQKGLGLSGEMDVTFNGYNEETEF